MIFEAGHNFDSFELSIFKEGKAISFEDLLKESNRSFSFNLNIDKLRFESHGIRGDDAIWIPLGDYGFKIIGENNKYSSLDISKEHIDKIKDMNLDIFPDIYWSEIVSFSDKSYMILKLENVHATQKSKLSPSDYYIPSKDRFFIEKFMQVSTTDCEKCINLFYEYNIKPEDEWYKSINLINGKIVDFHRFEVAPWRYLYSANNKSKEELQGIYEDLVHNYSSVLDHNKNPKWKGKIYQGFEFDNGYTFEGYTSDNKIFDSYKKLPFIPYGKVKNKNVLDIGSNQGFFSFQAVLHGAKEVTGLELQKEDVYTANQIKNILGFDNVMFKNCNAVEYVMNCEEKFSLIIANSVIHQIFKNLEGEECDLFMKKIANSCDYFAFESPVNHPTMTINISKIIFILKKYFKVVRLLNVYDAYSSGYRANFVCYS